MCTRFFVYVKELLRARYVHGHERARNFSNAAFIRNARLKLAKNQANAKQHPEAKFSLFENYCILRPRYHPRIIGNILKIYKNNCGCFNDVI